MSFGSDLEAAIASITPDAAILRAIVQGPASGTGSIVTLPSGALIKTLARIAAEMAGYVGAPSGGSTGQVLAKASGTNFDFAWVSPTVLRGYIDGLALSTAGSSTTFTVAPGMATDSTNAVLLALAAALSKTTGAWAVGAGNGSLDTGTIANNTWYDVYLIRRSDTGVTDVLTTLAGADPAMPTDYTHKRLIMSMLTNGSGQWVRLFQNGDDVAWLNPVGDYAAVPGVITRQAQTLAVPRNRVVFPRLLMNVISGASGGCTSLLTSLDEADSTITSSMYHSSVGAAYSYGAVIPVNGLHTNLSAQIGRKINTTDGMINITTLGWRDPRGRDL